MKFTFVHSSPSWDKEPQMSIPPLAKMLQHLSQLGGVEGSGSAQLSHITTAFTGREETK
jgi:hypothetical protein